MLYVKETPSGIDVPIQRFQNYLYDSIPDIWNIDGSKQYDCFGRAYRNQRQKNVGYVPEVYTGNGNYRDVYVDDTKTAISFFGVEDIQKFNITLTANVFLIFCVNLSKTHPAVKHRGDEETRRDVIGLSEQYRFGAFTGIATGIQSVFKGYDIQQIKYSDMHPMHCFRLNYTLAYSDECP